MTDITFNYFDVEAFRGSIDLTSQLDARLEFYVYEDNAFSTWANSIITPTDLEQFVIENYDSSCVYMLAAYEIIDGLALDNGTTADAALISASKDAHHSRGYCLQEADVDELSGDVTVDTDGTTMCVLFGGDSNWQTTRAENFSYADWEEQIIGEVRALDFAEISNAPAETIPYFTEFAGYFSTYVQDENPYWNYEMAYKFQWAGCPPQSEIQHVVDFKIDPNQKVIAHVIGGTGSTNAERIEETVTLDFWGSYQAEELECVEEEGDFAIGSFAQATIAMAMSLFALSMF